MKKLLLILALFLSSLAIAGQEYVNVTTFTDEDPVLIAVPGGGDAPASGEIIVYGVCIDDSTPPLASGYTEVHSGSVGGEVRYLVAHKTSDGSEGGTNISLDLTSPNGIERGAWFLLILSDVATSTQDAQEASGTGTSAAGTQLTGLASGDLVYSMVCSDNTVGQTLDGSLSSQGNVTGGSSGNGMALGSLTASGSTAGGFTHTIGSSIQWAVVNFAFRPSGGGGPSIIPIIQDHARRRR